MLNKARSSVGAPLYLQFELPFKLFIIEEW